MATRLAYRMQKLKHLALALSSEGARRTGGRWNPAGVPLRNCPPTRWKKLPWPTCPPAGTNGRTPTRCRSFCCPGCDPTLAFAVPSVVLAGSPSRNFLINPLYSRMAEVRVVGSQGLGFDGRLRP